MFKYILLFLRSLLPCLQSTGYGKDELALLDKNDNLKDGKESRGMDVPPRFHLQEARPASLDDSLLKRGVLVRLGLGWLGGVIAGRPQEASRRA